MNFWWNFYNVPYIHNVSLYSDPLCALYTENWANTRIIWIIKWDFLTKRIFIWWHRVCLTSDLLSHLTNSLFSSFVGLSPLAIILKLQSLKGTCLCLSYVKFPWNCSNCLPQKQRKRPISRTHLGLTFFRYFLVKKRFYCVLWRFISWNNNKKIKIATVLYIENKSVAVLKS